MEELGVDDVSDYFILWIFFFLTARYGYWHTELNYSTKKGCLT